MILVFGGGALLGMLFGRLLVGVLMIGKLDRLEAEARQLRLRLDAWRNLVRSA